MQFQVPQFIETEDKIVGPFSLREFMYMGSTGGTCLILYFMVEPTFWIIFASLLFGLGLALAFVKVNTRTLPELIRHAFFFYWRPQTYIWQPEGANIDKEALLRSLAQKKAAARKPTSITHIERPAREAGGGISLESILGGNALKKTWRNLQTGTKTSGSSLSAQSDERYEIFQRMSGEQQAAKRVDFL